jgi:hypothetical protein
MARGAGRTPNDIQTGMPDGDHAGFARGTPVWSGTSSLAVIGDRPVNALPHWHPTLVDTLEGRLLDFLQSS